MNCVIRKIHNNKIITDPAAPVTDVIVINSNTRPNKELVIVNNNPVIVAAKITSLHLIGKSGICLYITAKSIVAKKKDNTI